MVITVNVVKTVVKYGVIPRAPHVSVLRLYTTYPHSLALPQSTMERVWVSLFYVIDTGSTGSSDSACSEHAPCRIVCINTPLPLKYHGRLAD